jgi:hypothetical protein
MSQACEDRTSHCASSSKKYITGEWSHILREGEGDTICRILLDPDEVTLLRMQIMTSDGWQSASSFEYQDLEDSLKNANAEVFDDPVGCGLSYIEGLPSWAVA